MPTSWGQTWMVSVENRRQRTLEDTLDNIWNMVLEQLIDD